MQGTYLLFRPRVGLVASLTALALLTAVPATAAETVLGARTHSADIQYERGARALRSGDLIAAIEHLERAAQLAPQDGATLLLLALARISNAEPELALALLARARDLGADAERVTYLEGLALLRQSAWAAARIRFESVVTANTDHARAWLLLGVARAELGDREAAAAAFRTARELDPELSSEVNYRLGLLARERRRDSEARDLLEEARTGAPGTVLARSADRELQQLSRRPRRWRAWATVGAEWDSNANLIGDDGSLIGLARERDTRGITELGVMARLYDTESVRAWIGLELHASRHDEARDFDTEAGRASLRISADLAENLFADLRYFAESTWLDFDSFRRRHFVEPALRVRLSSSHAMRLFASYEKRDFFWHRSELKLAPDFDPDSRVRSLGLDFVMLLPEVASRRAPSLGLGYRRRVEDADGREYDSRAHVYSAAIDASLPAELRLRISGELERREYSHPHWFFFPFFSPPRDRCDDVTRVSLQLGRDFGRNLRVEARWRWTDWDADSDSRRLIPGRISNVYELYDYERQSGGLWVTYSFR